MVNPKQKPSDFRLLEKSPYDDWLLHERSKEVQELSEVSWLGNGPGWSDRCISYLKKMRYFPASDPLITQRIKTFQRSDLQRNMVYNVPSASFMKFKFSSFNLPHVFYRKALHCSSSLVGSSPKIFGTENLNPPPPPNLGGGPRILCLKGEASGLKRETNEAVNDLPITWSVAIYGRFPDISHGFLWNRISHITGDFFCSFPWNMPQTNFHRFGGTPLFSCAQKKLFETPLPVPATERG